MTRETIFSEISEEREYQDSKWGTQFDDKNTLNDWTSYINQYLSNATSNESVDEQRKGLLKAVTIGIAALETFDRNGKFADRHYD